MKKPITLIALIFTIHCSSYAAFILGTPPIQSMGVLEFSPDGTLFIGDSKSAAIFAIDLKNDQNNTGDKALQVMDVEEKIAALLATTKEEVMIHDMAVNPISKNVYLSVSRGRSGWTSNWQMPKELSDARVLIRIKNNASIEEVSLDNVNYTVANIPNPIANEKEHRWKKGTKLRTDAISDLAFENGKLYVAGLSNEEFASSMWIIPYPFSDEVSTTTLEIFHGAHGKYETSAPIRAFLPYKLNNKDHLIAAYLCTPLVTFETEDLQDGQHIKGRTVAEFGSGNFPIDMLVYEHKGKDFILMSNSALPLLIFDPLDVASFEGEINTEVESYLSGVPYTPRSGAGIYHLADYDEKYIVYTQRMANGSLLLGSLPKNWLSP